MRKADVDAGGGDTRPPGTGGTGSDGRSARPLPQFFLQWSSQWVGPTTHWTPTDYLNQQSAVPATIAAGWLFNPTTVEYRGGLFLADRFHGPTVDTWVSRFPDDLARVEAVVNELTLYDFFVNADLDPYEDALPGLARDIAACWAGVLAVRHPERRVRVNVKDGTDPSDYGPSVTFWTGDVNAVN